LSLAVVRDLREARVPAGPDELAAFETDVLAGFVLARAAAGLSDNTIRSDVLHLEQLRAWFGRPLWDMEPADADAYFGKVLRDAAKGTRLARSQALRTYFLFLEIRHKVAIHQMTGRVAECPVDEMKQRAQPRPSRWPREAGQTGTVPVFTAIRSTKEEPSSIPAASPRLPRSTSPWPPGRHPHARPGVPRSVMRERVRAAPGPYPPDLSR
jgi:hypothetical protein